MTRFVRPETEKDQAKLAAGAFIAALAANTGGDLSDEPSPHRAFQLTVIGVQALQMAVLEDCPEQMDEIVRAIGAAVGVAYGMSGDPIQTGLAGAILAQGFACGAEQARSFLTPPTDTPQ